MEDVLAQREDKVHANKAATVILDIESLVQSNEKCSNPKLTKALSRKGSGRSDKRSTEDQETEDVSKKLLVKVVSSQKEPLTSNKPLVLMTSPSTSINPSHSSNGRSKRFRTFRPREILLIFATLSSMGTLILIYFTLAINRKDGP